MKFLKNAPLALVSPTLAMHVSLLIPFLSLILPGRSMVRCRLRSASVVSIRELEGRQKAAEDRRKEQEKQLAQKISEKKKKADNVRAKAEKIKAETPRK